VTVPKPSTSNGSIKLIKFVAAAIGSERAGAPKYSHPASARPVRESAFPFLNQKVLATALFTSTTVLQSP
jgi:hypothetical protein